MTVNVLGAVADVIIAAGLFFYLHRSRTGFKKSDTMISKLVSGRDRCSPSLLGCVGFVGGLRSLQFVARASCFLVLAMSTTSRSRSAPLR